MKNFKASNIRKQIKTTILGLVFIAVALYRVVEIEDFNIWIFMTLIGVGILMLFAPDTLINSLIKFVVKNEETKIKD